MKMIKLSAVALLLTSTLAMAGGDIAPVEPVIETPEVVEAAPALTGFYAGLGYSCMQATFDTPDWTATSMSAISATAGYNINPFVAVEARYTRSLGDINLEAWNFDKDVAGELSNIALYLKPQYTMDKFKVYGLLGYGQTTIDDDQNTYKETGFQYGAGLGMMATDNIDVYVDYRRLYDDTGFDGGVAGSDTAVNSFTVGVNYNF